MPAKNQQARFQAKSDRKWLKKRIYQPFSSPKINRSIKISPYGTNILFYTKNNLLSRTYQAPLANQKH
jgi:hypothetical protein